MYMRKIIIALTCFHTVVCIADIPIIAYWGVKPEESTVNRFKEFHDAGFDVSISNFVDLPTTNFVKALNNAQKAKVKLFALSTDLWTKPERTIPRIKNHPALYGYFVCDEPQEKDFGTVKSRFLRMKKIDSTKPFYINLLPYYENHLMQGVGISSYSDYLKKARTIGAPQICFDYYPVLDSGVRPRWYENLEMIRAESKSTHRPFWGFVLSTPHVNYPNPTLASLRLQIYSNLVYGAQSLLYFTYWTPQPTAEYNFHDGPIGLDGKRTRNYYLVKQMNEELHSGILSLFDHAHVLTVNHIVKIPVGTTRLPTAPQHIKRLKVVGRYGAIVSTFVKNGHTYMAIVNKDYQQNMNIDMVATPKVKRVSKQLKEYPTKARYTVAPGDILLFRL